MSVYGVGRWTGPREWTWARLSGRRGTVAVFYSLPAARRYADKLSRETGQEWGVRVR